MNVGGATVGVHAGKRRGAIPRMQQVEHATRRRVVSDLRADFQSAQSIPVVKDEIYRGAVIIEQSACQTASRNRVDVIARMGGLEDRAVIDRQRIGNGYRAGPRRR